MNTYTIRIVIADDDNHANDYSDFFTMSSNEPIANKDLFETFKLRIKEAVKLWFEDEADGVIFETAHFGYNTEITCLGDVLDNFPMRCTAHIPNEILDKVGVKYIEADTTEYSYNDCGWLNY